MAAEPRPQYALEELAFLFGTLTELDSPCVLIGGQAACYWVQRFLPSEPALSEMAEISAFLSKDVDFQGNRDAVVAFARKLGKQADMAGFRHAFGNLMSGKFSIATPKGQLSVEILRRVPGLEMREVERLSSVEPFGTDVIRVLNPVAMLKAKSWNVCHITKEGRHDIEQLLAMVICVRSYFRAYLQSATSNPAVLRAGLTLIERALRFTELPTGRKTAEKCGLDWSRILPHAQIASSRQREIIRMRDQRLPLWLARIATYRLPLPDNPTQRRLLGILDRHAEPLCAEPDSAARRGKPRNSARP